MNELKYLQTYKSAHTLETYRASLKKFLNGIYGEGSLEDLATRYFQDNRNYESDIQDFLAKIKEAPPKTIHLRISSVRTFLLENKVELRQIFWRGISRRIQGNDARTDDKVPTNLELRRILTHAPIQGKALYLVISSSGMRIGETLQLKLEDIDITHDPVQINLRGEYTKSGNRRVTFVSGEAKEYLQEWLKCRDSYLKTAVGRSKRHKKSLDDNHIFPFDESTARFIWVNALEKAQLNQKDSSTNRLVRHEHVLRKFFRTRLGAVIQPDIVEFLMGHEGYLTSEYRKYEVEDLAKFYKQGESALTVMGGSLESAVLVNGLTGDVETLKKQIEELKGNYSVLETAFNKAVDNLNADKKELEQRIDQIVADLERERDYDRIQRELKKEEELNTRKA